MVVSRMNDVFHVNSFGMTGIELLAPDVWVIDASDTDSELSHAFKLIDPVAHSMIGRGSDYE